MWWMRLNKKSYVDLKKKKARTDLIKDMMCLLITHAHRLGHGGRGHFHRIHMSLTQL